MSSAAIVVENLGKEYQIGARENGYRTFREAVMDLAASPLERFKRLSGRAGETERFWALKDVSFEVQPGEVVGIIGRNGAGKSTLLKVLSRITEPTEGRAVIHGRVGSLLEVGTGFHQELTGRENVYLNGSILGMSRREIRGKFDEIVEFSGVEKFLDTPVKRYSSGMKIRLGFAVAAHLEPEILIVDEVLAVGDAEFQKKCLGKMNDVANSGRTVLFVSHNMAAVESLCHRGIVLEEGRPIAIGNVNEAIEHYYQTVFDSTETYAFSTPDYDGQSIIRNVESVDSNGDVVSHIAMGGELHLQVALDAPFDLKSPVVGIGIDGPTGQRLLSLNSNQDSLEGVSGKCVIRCVVPFFPLPPGDYFATVILRANNEDLARIERACRFSVVNANTLNDSRGFHAGVCIASSLWSVDRRTTQFVNC